MKTIFEFFGKLLDTIMKRLYPMPSTDHISTVPEPDIIPASPVVIAPDTPKQPVQPINPPTMTNPTLTQICTYMRDFEGKPGDANYRNNNPLNCKFYHGGYLPMYEPVKISSAGFAIFKDYATGWLYGFNMMKNKIHHHPEWTILDMIADHAPASDANPVVQYATNVAKRAGVDIHFPVKNIIPT